MRVATVHCEICTLFPLVVNSSFIFCHPVCSALADNCSRGRHTGTDWANRCANQTQEVHASRTRSAVYSLQHRVRQRSDYRCLLQTHCWLRTVKKLCCNNQQSFLPACPCWQQLASWWLPCIADADIIFSSCCFFYLSSSFFPRLISAVADWMSTILPHMVWP